VVSQSDPETRSDNHEGVTATLGHLCQGLAHQVLLRSGVGQVTKPRHILLFELDTALAYQARYRDRPTDNPLILRMREDNDREIKRLRAQLDATD